VYTNGRLSILKGVYVFAFFGLVVRLGQIMILDHAHYQALAYDQHIVEQELSAKRGEILTSDGYPLVNNTQTFLVFAVPQEMIDKKSQINVITDTIMGWLANEPVDEKIHKRLYTDHDEESFKIALPTSLHSLRYMFPLDQLDWKPYMKESLHDTIAKLCAQENNQFVQLLSDVTKEQADTLVTKEKMGLHVLSGTRRTYPEGTMLSQVLGFVGKDEQGFDKGYFGLEGFYEGDLSGRAGYAITETDVSGKPIPYGESYRKEPADGRDLVLTINRELQYLLEKKLQEGVEKYGAKNGTAVLMDPYSGGILAMANYPSYFPEYWTDELKGESDVSNVGVFRNLAIGGNYEPGSVMKPITISMALNEGLVNPSTTYEDNGPVVYSGFPVRTWNNKYLGTITMTQILEHSINTGAAWVGHQVGFDTFSTYLSAFGFGDVTGVDLQGEEMGIVRDPSSWRDIDLANMSFGQGISVTPLQMVTVFSSLINGGHLYKPHIVKRLIDYDSLGNITPIEIPSEEVSSPISADTSESMRLMLGRVVTDGEFKWFVSHAGMQDYSVGGKTGTAQIPVHGQYDPNKTNTTFIGYASIESPKFVLLFKLSEPSASTYSADTVVPLWFEYARDLMVYFNIAPKVGP